LPEYGLKLIEQARQECTILLLMVPHSTLLIQITLPGQYLPVFIEKLRFRNEADEYQGPVNTSFG
jgi:hypothetical protein